MNILVPLNSEAHIDRFAELGASEFYMGFYDPDWNDRFGNYSDINRLTLFEKTANRYRLEDMQRITEKIHARGACLYITMNAPGYRAEQVDVLELYMDRLAAFGVDGIIVSEPELIEPVRRYGLKAVASTMCAVSHADQAAWYREQGIQRVIFPREMTVHEIQQILHAVPDLEYEVFLMRNGCRYSDANCLGIHGGSEGALCYSLRSGDARYHVRGWAGDDFERQLQWTHRLFCTDYHEYACGQCGVYRFMQMGVRAVKIVGRLDNMDDIAEDVRLTAENIRIAETCGSEAEYLERMVRPGPVESFCRQGLSCYYPEILWK